MAPLRPSSPRTKSPTKRKRKLPLPALQLRLVGGFAGLTSVALMLQFLLFSAHLTDVGRRLESGGLEVLGYSMPGTLLGVLVGSLVIVLPVCMVVGMWITFRWAGPLYRIQEHLREVAEGSGEVGTCRVRKDDELQELCGLVNRALQTTRRDARAEVQDERAGELERAA